MVGKLQSSCCEVPRKYDFMYNGQRVFSIEEPNLTDPRYTTSNVRPQLFITT